MCEVFFFKLVVVFVFFKYDIYLLDRLLYWLVKWIRFDFIVCRIFFFVGWIFLNFRIIVLMFFFIFWSLLLYFFILFLNSIRVCWVSVFIDCRCWFGRLYVLIFMVYECVVLNFFYCVVISFRFELFYCFFGEGEKL